MVAINNNANDNEQDNCNINSSSNNNWLINSNNNSNSSNNHNNNSHNNIGCNKFKQQLRQQKQQQQQQQRILPSENHKSSNNNNNKYSHNTSNIDVQTFTNTKELNQVNLNSSSASSHSLATSLEAVPAATTTIITTTTTAAAAATTATISSSSTTTLAILATATVAAEIARQQQQQQQPQSQQQQHQLRQRQQLIMSPTALASSAASSSTCASTTAPATVTAVHLRKSHSTPAFKFDASSNIVDERVYSNSNTNSNCNSNKYSNKNHVEFAMEASNIAIKDVAVVAHFKRQQQQQQHPQQQQHQQQQQQQQHQQQQQQQQHEPFSRVNGSDSNSNNCNNIDATMPTTPESLRFGCTHYKRRAMFVTPCCNKFYKCRFCHDENESHHFDRKTLTELICSECNTRQKVQEQCEKCGVRFGKYTCLICNLFDDADKQQYHCHGCGICRIGGAHNFFHCEVCNMCLPIQLKIDGHRCVENISRSHCPVCLGDIHTSRIPCHIPDCGHLLHKMCFDQLLASGHYTCPTCQTSLIDMTALWDYLDAQAVRMPVALKYENQRVHIFCNDCHKTSKTKFHFIGLKCVHCGAYNTTQDVKRRLSLVTDEPSTA